MSLYINKNQVTNNYAVCIICAILEKVLSLHVRTEKKNMLFCVQGGQIICLKVKPAFLFHKQIA